MGLMNSIVSIGSVVLQSAVNSLGEMTIAAHVAARKIVEMFMQPLISIAIAVTTFVSQNLGAKQYHRIREGMKKSVWISFGWVGIVILLSFTCIDFFIGFLVNKQSDTGCFTSGLLYQNQQCILFHPCYLIYLSQWFAGALAMGEVRLYPAVLKWALRLLQPLL